MGPGSQGGCDVPIPPAGGSRRQENACRRREPRAALRVTSQLQVFQVEQITPPEPRRRGRGPPLKQPAVGHLQEPRAALLEHSAFILAVHFWLVQSEPRPNSAKGSVKLVPVAPGFFPLLLTTPPRTPKPLNSPRSHPLLFPLNPLRPSTAFSSQQPGHV